jgi:hypothetical protein
MPYFEGSLQVLSADGLLAVELTHFVGFIGQAGNEL